MANREKLSAVVRAAAEEMSFMLMDPKKPKGKPWQVVPVSVLTERVLPLCEFVRGCEASKDPELAERARFALQFFLTDPLLEDDPYNTEASA